MRKLFNKYEKTMKKLFAKNREPRTQENTTFQKNFRVPRVPSISTTCKSSLQKTSRQNNKSQTYNCSTNKYNPTQKPTFPDFNRFPFSGVSYSPCALTIAFAEWVVCGLYKHWSSTIPILLFCHGFPKFQLPPTSVNPNPRFNELNKLSKYA